MRKIRMLLMACAFAAFAVPSAAKAESQDRGYVYDFEPDDLVGDTLSAPPPLLKIRAIKLPRVMLLRPRASFVAELSTSIENL